MFSVSHRPLRQLSGVSVCPIDLCGRSVVFSVSHKTFAAGQWCFLCPIDLCGRSVVFSVSHRPAERLADHQSDAFVQRVRGDGHGEGGVDGPHRQVCPGPAQET